MKCTHYDDHGFCNLYSNDAVVWKCKRYNCKGFEQIKVEYPCTTCKLVKYPHLCENKCCDVWRKWFIQKWEETRKGLRKDGR